MCILFLFHSHQYGLCYFTIFEDILPHCSCCWWCCCCCFVCVCVCVLCCVCIQNEYMSKMCNSPVLGACNMAKRIRLFQEHTACLIILFQEHTTCLMMLLPVTAWIKRAKLQLTPAMHSARNFFPDPWGPYSR